MLPATHDHNRAFWTAGADGQLHIAWCATVRAVGVAPRPRTAPTVGERLSPSRFPGGGPCSPTRSTINRSTRGTAAVCDRDRRTRRTPDLRIATNIVDCEPDSVHVGCLSRCVSNARKSATTPRSFLCSGHRAAPRHNAGVGFGEGPRRIGTFGGCVGVRRPRRASRRNGYVRMCSGIGWRRNRAARLQRGVMGIPAMRSSGSVYAARAGSTAAAGR